MQFLKINIVKPAASNRATSRTHGMVRKKVSSEMRECRRVELSAVKADRHPAVSISANECLKSIILICETKQ